MEPKKITIGMLTQKYWKTFGQPRGRQTWILKSTGSGETFTIENTEYRSLMKTLKKLVSDRGLGGFQSFELLSSSSPTYKQVDISECNSLPSGVEVSSIHLPTDPEVRIVALKDGTYWIYMVFKNKYKGPYLNYRDAKLERDSLAQLFSAR